MPTYQYACQACDEQFEVVQAFSDDSLTEHEPGCGGPVRKVFGSVGVVFKGSGFYRTDSRSGSSSSEAPKGESTSAAKSESSPAKSESSAKSDSGSSAAKTGGGSSSSSTSSSGTAAA